MSDALKALFAEQFKRVNKQENHVSEERQKLDALRKDYEEARKEAEMFRALKGKSPFEILEAYGISYDKLLEADKARHNPQYAIERKYQSMFEELRSELEMTRRQKEEEELKQKERELLATIRQTVKEKEYDIIDKLDLFDTVKDKMAQHYQEKGELLSYEDACQSVIGDIANKFNSVKDSKWLSQQVSSKLETSQIKDSKVVSKQEEVKPEAKVDASSDLQKVLAEKLALRQAKAQAQAQPYAPIPSNVMNTSVTSKSAQPEGIKSRDQLKAEAIAAFASSANK